MSVILIMLPIALVLAGIGIAAFIIAAKNGQFDDLDTPAIRAVFDDDEREYSVQIEHEKTPIDKSGSDGKWSEGESNS